MNKKIILPVTLALFAAVPLIELAKYGLPIIFKYFTADSYYYLTIALNFPKTGFLTFDQQLPTNGFQPLWQWILSVVGYLSSGLSDPKPVVMVVVYFLSIVLIAASLKLIHLSLFKTFRKTPCLFLLLPFGVYYLIMVLGGFTYVFGHLWSFINGMESPLSLFFYSLLVFLITKNRFYYKRTDFVQYVFLVITLILFIFSRLDNFFVLAGFAVYGVTYSAVYKDKTALSKTLLICGIPSLLLIIFLWYNHVAVGSSFPISARIKTSFPSIEHRNFREFASFILYPEKRHTWVGWRFSQMLLPLTAALGLLVGLIRKATRTPQTIRNRIFLLSVVTSVYIILLSAYNFLFVYYWHQGQWYFPVPVFFLFFLFWGILEKLAGYFPLAFIARSSNLVIIMILIAYGFFYTQDLSWKRKNGYLYRIFQDRKNFARKYQHTDSKFISFDDGIVAFSTGFPTINGMGFCLDNEGLKRKRRQSLLNYAYDRGYTYLAAANYFREKKIIDYQTGSDKCKELLASTMFLSSRELRDYQVKVDYLPQDRTYVIFKMNKNYSGL